MRQFEISNQTKTTKTLNLVALTASDEEDLLKREKFIGRKRDFFI